MASPFPAVQEQDPIEEVLPDLFLVRGSTSVAPGLRISRNMVVFRDGEELTLVGPVRMPAEAEQHLETLGRVARILRIGPFHGMDDAYTLSRFGGELWSLRGTNAIHTDPAPHVVFDADDPSPLSDTELVKIEGLVIAEAALLWKRHGGVLLTADALQHYGDWRHFNLPSRWFHRAVGFGAGTIVGPMWHRFLCRDDDATQKTFAALLEKGFEHAVGLHGSFVRGSAAAAVDRALAREFRDGPAMPNWAYYAFRPAMRKLVGTIAR